MDIILNIAISWLGGADKMIWVLHAKGTFKVKSANFAVLQNLEKIWGQLQERESLKAYGRNFRT